jgi:peptide/nickel transport system ATP-binding protein
MVLQNPYTSLNPRMRIGALIAEPLRIHGIVEGRTEIQERVASLLASVGLPHDITSRYPSMLSGGQRQRVAIARALAVRPALLVADEPTSALDVSIQAQIVTLLKELQVTLGLACLFITHDLSLVPSVANRVAVMRQGKLVEVGITRDVFRTPQDAYTRQLLEDASERSLPPPAGAAAT